MVHSALTRHGPVGAARSLFCTVLLSVLLSSVLFGCARVETGTAPVDAAAQRWLGYVDRKDFGGSWDAGSEWLRLEVGKAKWEQGLESVWQQAGTATSRELHALRITRSLKNSIEPADFAVVQYRTEYAGRGGVETLMLRREGTDWRVVGYRVEPRMPWDS